MALRRDNAGSTDLGPLAVHPVLAQQGMSGKMGQGLNSIIKQYAGEKRLVRVTKLLVGGFGVDWAFYGIDIKGDQITRTAIPGIDKVYQYFDLITSENRAFDGSFSPANDGINTLDGLIDSGAVLADQRKYSFDSALRIQNPASVSPDTTDCASCHVAENVEKFNGPFWIPEAASDKNNVNRFVADSRFLAPSQLVQTTALDVTQLHAFSYKGRDPRINQRVINETASILAYVNGTLLKN